MLHAHDGFDTPTIPLLLNLLDYGYDNCQTVIVEGILRSDWYQPIWQKVLELYRLEDIYAYYYDLPFDETVKRHSGREKAKAFGQDALKRWWVDKDYLKIIPETAFSKEISLEEAKRQILLNYQNS